MANNIRFAAGPFHCTERPELFSMGFQLCLYLGPFKALMAVHVFLKTGSQCFEQIFTLFWRQVFFVAVSRFCCIHDCRFPRFLLVIPLRLGRDFLRPVFAFLSTRSFHAVRSAPASTSSLAAARRICVCPIFPQPPGIGRKISGASSTNAACCSSVSIRFP